MSSTPNLGLALPAHGSPLWDVPLNANFTGIDTVVGGGTAGQVLTSNGANSAPSYQTTGTVTSVGLNVPAEFSVAGSPVTNTGTLIVSKATQTANLVYAGPSSGGAAQPTFRALASADIPFSVPNFTTAPFWWMSGQGSNYPYTTAAGQFSTGTGNQVQFWMVQVPYAIKITTATFRYISAGAGGVGGMAWYDFTGQTKLISFDNFAFSGGAGPKVITATGGSVSLPLGAYLIACSQSATGTSANTSGGYLTHGSSDVTDAWNANGTIRSGVGTNAMVAGILPASLGTLTLTASAPASTLPSVCFEP